MLRIISKSLDRSLKAWDAVSSHQHIRSLIRGKPQNVIIRPARPEDYEQVLAIVPDLYGGADYMPNKYHSYFSDPKAHPYVGEVDGQVASFTNYYVEDNGQTSVSTGGRTIPRYQGTGLNNRVNKASLAAAFNQYPGLKTEARVAVDDEFYERYRKPDPTTFQIVTEQYFLQYLTTKRKILNLLEHLQKAPATTSVTSTMYMDTSTAITTLPDKLLHSDLFPDSSFITPSSYHPLHVTRDNIELVCGTTDVVATMGSGSGVECRGVSFSLCTQFKIGPSVTTFYYVKTLQDMFHHLRLHLEREKEEFMMNGNAILELAFPLDLSLDETKEALFPFLGKNDIYDSTPRETMIVLERPLNVRHAKL